MILKRLRVTGFKSFGAKTLLEFEPGVTAIVGPNGSGKSNLADAVRWVLGEQNRARLRLTDRDEVIFAGTDDRARASVAEVSITFDNADGSLPIDLAEVEITRTLYRSGESEYRLCGKAARLADITALLLPAGVSAGGYTVIGQGMIDSFLLSGPAERKALFEEAAGIKGPEQSRQAALRKLAATADNLARLRDIAAELGPRLESLRRIVGTADDRRELAEHIAALRGQIVGVRLHLARRGFRQAEAAITQAQAALAELEPQLAAAQEREAGLATQREATATATAELTRQVADLEAQRETVAADLRTTQDTLASARLAEQAARLSQDRAEALAAQIAQAQERRAELEAELASNAAAAERATAALDKAGEAVARAQRRLVALRADQSDSSRDQYLTHALEILRVLAAGLSSDSLPDDQVRLLVHKAGRLLSHAKRRGNAEVVAEIQAAQSALQATMAKRDTAAEHQTNITITRRSLEIDLEYQQDLIARLQDEAGELDDRSRLSGPSASQLAQRSSSLTGHLDRLTAELTTARHKLLGCQSEAPAAGAEAEAAVAVERLLAERRHQREALEAHTATAETARAAESEALTLASSWHMGAEAAAAAAIQAEAASATPATLSELATQLAAAEARQNSAATAQAEQIAEYEAVQARHTELTAQIQDLTAAEADLRQVVARLDELIRERFKENFQTLSDQFSVYFARLFEGGAAKLTLESASEAGEYGIGIKASPAGKRLGQLAALSGGERALTGIALLAAILRVNPSPFIILDEVDAALDESNSGRLSGILGELAERSQLIVITHNRQTMQAARVLFGVTLSAQHVSTVLSLRLDEAEALAAR